MSSPYSFLTIFAVYLWFVFKAGPKFMENRKALDLSNVTRAYNIFQLVSSSVTVIVGHSIGLSFKFGYQCVAAPSPLDEVTDAKMFLFRGTWLYIMLRASELAETVFFVLRKKQNQVSFLHVYHHIAVVSLLWLYLKYNAGEGETFLVLLNSSVHVVMYLYYFLSSFESMKGITGRVKKFITRIQITQLVVLLTHCIWAIVGCNATKLYYLQTLNIIILVFMFARFYFKSYKSKQSRFRPVSEKINIE